jgi:hypothetical protein
MLAEIVWDKHTLGVVFGCGIPIVFILATAWYKVERMKSTNELKRKMVERGMSAEEIERVMNTPDEAKDHDVV